MKTSSITTLIINLLRIAATAAAITPAITAKAHATQAATSATTDFIIPANSYALSSSAGTFTDISQNAKTVKLGENLAAGTALKDGFFVNKQSDNAASNDNFVTHSTADSTKKDPGFDLGFIFNLCGKSMGYFTICASGGIHFAEQNGIYQTPGSAWATTSKSNPVAYKDLITTAIYDHNNQLNSMVSIEGQAPVMYLIEGETNAKTLTVQYHYALNGDEWIYQIKCYEATGNIEVVVKELQTAHLEDDKNYSFFVGLVENGMYSLYITDDLFATLDIGNYATHRIGIQQDAATSGWNSIKSFTGGMSAAPGKTNSLLVSKTQYPENGRTLTFAPTACTDKAEKIKDCYTHSAVSVTGTQYKGKVMFDTTKIKASELINAGCLMVVISDKATPDYTLRNGTWYAPTGYAAANAQILFNQKPTFRTKNNDAFFSGNITAIDFTAENLSPDTRYYLHFYTMDYRCLDAPIYSDLCKIDSFTTSLTRPEKLSADGLPSTTGVPVRVQSSGEGLGVVLLKSPVDKPLTLSGKLQAGDKIALSANENAEVLTIINSSADSGYTVPLASGEGTYILAMSIRDPESDNPQYSNDHLSLPVRAAYNSLPTLTFENETGQYAQTGQYPRLPFGWSRETELPVEQRSGAFGLVITERNEKLNYLTSFYHPDMGELVDVITPAFICGSFDNAENMIHATFYTSYFTVGDLDNASHIPGAGDTVRIEYSVDGGAWMEAWAQKGNGEKFPILNEQKLYPVSVQFSVPSPTSVIRLRYRYRSLATDKLIYHRIHKVDFDSDYEPVDCAPVKNLRRSIGVGQVRLEWEAAPTAVKYGVFYGKSTSDVMSDSIYIDATPDSISYTVALNDLDEDTRYKAQVVAYCNSDLTLFSEPVVTSFYTMRSCHAPQNFHVAKVEDKGVVLVSTTDQSDYTLSRTVKIWRAAEAEAETEPMADATAAQATDTLSFTHKGDTLYIKDSLLPERTYTAIASATCTDYTVSNFTESLSFTTLKADTVHIETETQLQALFKVYVQNGRIHIRNLSGEKIKDVRIYNRAGVLLHTVMVNSSDDLFLPAPAHERIVLVRLNTPRGAAVYKIGTL